MKTFIISILFLVVGIFIGSWLEYNTVLVPRFETNSYEIPLLTGYGWGIARDSKGAIYYKKERFILYIN